MNLEEYKEVNGANYANKELNEEYTSKSGNFHGFYSSYQTGFDAAIALELPIKFMEWSANLLSTRKDGHILHMLPEVSMQDRWYTEEQLYKYWIENIFKITE